MKDFWGILYYNFYSAEESVYTAVGKFILEHASQADLDTESESYEKLQYGILAVARTEPWSVNWMLRHEPVRCLQNLEHAPTVLPITAANVYAEQTCN